MAVSEGFPHPPAIRKTPIARGTSRRTMCDAFTRISGWVAWNRLLVRWAAGAHEESRIEALPGVLPLQITDGETQGVYMAVECTPGFEIVPNRLILAAGRGGGNACSPYEDDPV